MGIYVKTDGVLVVGTGEFTGFDGVRYSPAKPVLKSGDYILKINGEDVTGKKMFINMLQEAGSKRCGTDDPQGGRGVRYQDCSDTGSGRHV